MLLRECAVAAYTMLTIFAVSAPATVCAEQGPAFEIPKIPDVKIDGKADDWADNGFKIEALCDVVFEWGTRGTDVPGLRARQEISSAPDERVVYDQFDAPIVTNRDYAITVKRTRGADGVCRIRYWATNEKAPKKPEGWVRLDKLWGSWTFTSRQGQTELVYTQFSDPGGSLPAIFANKSQRDRALQSVRVAIEKAKAASK